MAKEEKAIYRGTTPRLTFTVPFAPELINNVHIAFSQKGEVIVLKTLKADSEGKRYVFIEDSTIDDASDIRVNLTQEDTFAFTAGRDIEMQIRIMDWQNDVLASGEMTVGCNRSFEEDELLTRQKEIENGDI